MSRTEFLDTDTGETFWWKDCEVEGCGRQVCLNISDKFCFPHSEGNKHVKHMKIDAFNIKDPEKEPA